MSLILRLLYPVPALTILIKESEFSSVIVILYVNSLIDKNSLISNSNSASLFPIPSTINIDGLFCVWL